MTDVDSDYQVGMPEVQVVPNRNKAADLGISMATIGETVNSAIGGQRVGKFKDKGRRFDIRVRLLAPQRQRPEDIQRLLVRTVQGGLVRLGDIVKIEQRPTLIASPARNAKRRDSRSANVAPGLAGRRHREVCWPSRGRSSPTAIPAIPRAAAGLHGSLQSLGFASGWLLVAYWSVATQFQRVLASVTVCRPALQHQRRPHGPVDRGRA